MFSGRNSNRDFLGDPGGGGGSIIWAIGMCGPKGHGFSAVLVIDRVSILAILVLKGYGLVH